MIIMQYKINKYQILIQIFMKRIDLLLINTSFHHIELFFFSIFNDDRKFGHIDVKDIPTSLIILYVSTYLNTIFNVYAQGGRDLKH